MRRIVEKIAPRLGVLPVDKDAPEISRNLILNLRIGEEGDGSAAL